MLRSRLCCVAEIEMHKAVVVFGEAEDLGDAHARGSAGDNSLTKTSG